MPTLTPVEGNPFEERKLTPVEGNPFGNQTPEISQGIPRWKYKLSEYARPTLEGIGLVGGGIVGAAGGIPTGGTASPALGVLGGGLGYAAGAEAADLLDEYLGIKKSGTIGQEFAEAGQNIVKGAAMEAGGQLTAAGIGAAAGYAASKLQPWQLGITDRGIAKKAGQILSENRSPGGRYSANEETARQLENQIPGLKYTRGQATNDPAVIKMERARVRMPGEQAALAKEQFTEGQQAIRQYGEKTFGTSGEAPLVSGVARYQKQLQAATKQAQKDVAFLTGKLSQGAPDEKAGEIIVDSAYKAKAAARLNAGKLYDSLPDVKLNTTPLQSSLNQLKADYDPLIEKGSTYPTKLVNGLSSKIKDAPQKNFALYGRTINQPSEISFKDLKALRTTIKSELRAANSGLNPNPQLARRLNILLDATDDTLRQAENIPGSLGEQYKAASDWYRQNYVDIFRKGAARDILTSDASGAAKVRNSQVAAKFFQPGRLGVETADDFLRAVGSDQEAAAAMKDFISHDMLSKVTDASGNVSASKLQNYIKNYTPSLRKFGLEEQANSVLKAQQLVDSAIETEQLFNRSAAARILEASPEKVISEAFKGKGLVNPAVTYRQIASMVKSDPAASKGLQTSLANHIMKQAEANGVDFGGPIMQQAALKKQVAKYMPALKEAFKNEPEKIKAMLDIQKAVETLYRNQASPIGGGSDTAENVFSQVLQTSGLGKRSLSATINAVRAVGKILTKHGDEQVNVLLNRAMFDPELAYNLMYTANGTRSPQYFDKWLRGHLSTIGIYAVEKD